MRIILTGFSSQSSHWSSFSPPTMFRLHLITIGVLRVDTIFWDILLCLVCVMVTLSCKCKPYKFTDCFPASRICLEISRSINICWMNEQIYCFLWLTIICPHSHPAAIVIFLAKKFLAWQDLTSPNFSSLTPCNSYFFSL